ncbi:MAG: SRPBCC family protein [Miltoncostaeaceae bacterium]
MAVRPIASSRQIAAPPQVVHELLTSIEAWRLWSPHVASVEPPHGRVEEGWKGQVRAWFAPVPTTMIVTRVVEDGGIEWETPWLGHRLSYRQRIESAPAGSRVDFEARVEGPLAGPIAAVARPLSALGQRRRLGRLAALAEFMARPSSG